MTRRSKPAVLIIGICALHLGSCSQNILHRGVAKVSSHGADSGQVPTSLAPTVDEDNSTDGTGASLIVLLKEDESTLTPAAAKRRKGQQLSAAEIGVRKQAYKRTKDEIILALKSHNISIEHDFAQLPMVVINAPSEEARLALKSDSRVKRVGRNRAIPLLETPWNLTQIHQPEAATRGFLGAGKSTAVLDGGVDYTHPDFGSCTEPGLPASTCKVIVREKFGFNPNVTSDHGTHVAGIIAGVAPAAKIISLDVSYDDRAIDEWGALKAIDWAIENREKYNIGAMNLSFGGPHIGLCPDTDFAVAIQKARDVGILAAVASGNSGAIDNIDYPACSPDAISVGAVDERDSVAGFSNSSKDLTMLAPGVSILAAGMTKYGTSMATPHVAGAIGVLESAYPKESMEEIFLRLIDGARFVQDSRNDIFKPRLDLFGALTAKDAPSNCYAVIKNSEIESGPNGGRYEVSINTYSTCAWSLEIFTGLSRNWLTVDGPLAGTGPATIIVQTAPVVPPSFFGIRTGSVIVKSGTSSADIVVSQWSDDNGAPQGSMSIEGGSEATSKLQVAVAINPKDLSKITEMCISESTTCDKFVPFTSAATWQLSPGDGEKTIFAWLRDEFGNTTPAETPITAKIILDTVAPFGGKVVINQGRKYSNNFRVSLRVSAKDEGSGVAFVSINTRPNCNAVFRPYKPEDFMYLMWKDQKEGKMTVYVCFMDSAGNETKTPSQSSIIMDTIPPTMGNLSGTVTKNAATLKWTAALDNASGVASYSLVYLKGNEVLKKSCKSGNTVELTKPLSATVVGLSPNTKYTFRLCATDQAGNISDGTTWSSTTSK